MSSRSTCPNSELSATVYEMSEVINDVQLESVTIRAFESSLPMALMRAREAVMRQFRPVLAEHGLTEQQWRVLRALHGADSALSVGDLAECTFLLGPSLSRMLASLDDRGLIARTSVPEDARRAEIRITQSGIELVAEIAPHSESVYETIDAHLGADKVADLNRLLERIAQLS